MNKPKIRKLRYEQAEACRDAIKVPGYDRVWCPHNNVTCNYLGIGDYAQIGSGENMRRFERCRSPYNEKMHQQVPEHRDAQGFIVDSSALPVVQSQSQDLLDRHTKSERARGCTAESIRDDFLKKLDDSKRPRKGELPLGI